MRLEIRTSVVVLVCALSGCINLEGAYDDCVSSGRCSGDGGPDAGAADAGPDDAGPVPYDGGKPCTGSTNPRLRCDPPIQVGTGSSITGGALSASAAGFIAGWVGTTAEVREVHLDGTSTKLVTGVPVTDAQIAVDGRGSHWAAAWVDYHAATASCLSDRSDAGVLVTPRDGGQFDVLNIATSPSGAVALTATLVDGRLLGGHSSDGCLSELPPLPVSSVNSGAVAWTTASSGAGFRYVWTEQINAYNGSIGMLSIEADGGGAVQVSTGINLHAPQYLSVAASTSGSTVLTAFSQVNTNDQIELGLFGTSANLSNDGVPATVSTVYPGWWALGACGDGCVATGLLAWDIVAPATISFYADDPGIAPRGSYDLACAQQALMSTAASISVASFGGRLGVLLTSSSAANLYLCDVPPLP